MVPAERVKDSQEPETFGVVDVTHLVTDRARLLAIIALSVHVFAVGLAPALRGAAVGISRATDIALWLADVLSQVLGFFLVTTIVASLVRFARSRAPLLLKLTLLFFGAFPLLWLVFVASLDGFPGWLGGGLLVATGLVGVAVGVDALRGGFGRELALLPLFVGVGAGLRGVAGILGGGPLTRPLWVAAFALSTLALVALLVWLARSSARGAILAGGGVAVAAALSAAALSSGETESALVHVARQATLRLASGEIPPIPRAVTIFITLLAPSVALAVAAVRREVGPKLGAVALLALAAVLPQKPLLAGCLVSGSLALSLVLRDPRGTFAALDRAAARRP